MKARHLLALSSALLLLAPVSAPAGQVTGTATGTIVGTVTDASGARVPAVEVALTGNTLMGGRNTSTAEEGRYRFAALAPGEYRLTFSRAGFASRVHDVSLAIGFTATVDVVLEVASQGEEVTVAGRNQVLDRQSAALAKTGAWQVAEQPGIERGCRCCRRHRREPVARHGSSPPAMRLPAVSRHPLRRLRQPPLAIVQRR